MAKVSTPWNASEHRIVPTGHRRGLVSRRAATGLSMVCNTLPTMIDTGDLNAGGSTTGASTTSGPDSRPTTAPTAEAPSGPPGPQPLPSTPTASLSPSRASDFLSCPLRYRFRVIDKIPERPSMEAARGSVVHAVLERLFDHPAPERTVSAAEALLRPQWDAMLETAPDLAEVVSDDDGEPDPERLREFLSGAEKLLGRYFDLEDPTRLEPAERETYVECLLDSGLTLRGYIDRLDVAPGGAIRVVDYKTGRAPREGFEQRALFQMRFYALVLWRLRDVVPRMLQLVYLGSGDVLRYEPDEADLRATERKLQALWAAIEKARTTGDWRANPGPLCSWCDHKSRCPAWGGTPPPLPSEDSEGTSSDQLEPTSLVDL